MGDIKTFILCIVFGFVFGVGLAADILKSRIKSGELIIVDYSSYRCKMVNTLKER